MKQIILTLTFLIYAAFSFAQELKVKEIAQVLNIGEACAASRLHRAEKKLAAALKGWYFDED